MFLKSFIINNAIEEPTIDIMLKDNIYLHMTLWLWFATVIALDNSPITADEHVVKEVFPLHFHETVCVETRDIFIIAGRQMNL